MRHLRVTARPDPDLAPEFFTLLARSDHASEARLLDWNLGPAEAATLLYAVVGDVAAFRASATESAGIESADVEPAGEDSFFMLVEARPAAVPLFSRVVAALTRAGLVVLTPVVYCEGVVEADIVGEAASLQETVDAVPDAADVRVEEVGPFDGPPTSPATRLSERQREAVLAALELGYYDRPSRATHRDIADALGCSSSTASEHLKKAEATLARASLRHDTRLDTSG